MKQVSLPDGEMVPAFGLGTWRMGENASRKQDEVNALKAGLDMGVTLIDTAEMYGEGGAEKVTAEAVAGRRDEVFIVSKVYPHNASREGAIAACERSLARLATDRIDLYLLHWPGSHPLADTVAAFEQLKQQGKIRHWGVSNFDVADLADLADVQDGSNCASNQVLFSLSERGIEWQLLPDSQRAGLPIMAYSPLGQGDLTSHPALGTIAARHTVSPATIALAWVMQNEGVIAIPKAANLEHLQENVAACELTLGGEDLSELDAAFPSPTGPVPLVIN